LTPKTKSDVAGFYFVKYSQNDDIQLVEVSQSISTIIAKMITPPEHRLELIVKDVCVEIY